MKNILGSDFVSISNSIFNKNEIAAIHTFSSFEDDDNIAGKTVVVLKNGTEIILNSL